MRIEMSEMRYQMSDIRDEISEMREIPVMKEISEMGYQK
jgi:hypothetical protein